MPKSPEKFQSQQARNNKIAASVGIVAVVGLAGSLLYFVGENTKAPGVACHVVSVSRDDRDPSRGLLTTSDPVLPRKIILAGFDGNHKQIDYQVAQHDPNDIDSNNYTFDASSTKLPAGTDVYVYARLQEDKPPQCGEFTVEGDGSFVIDQQ